jgi:hypothetical protein
MAGLIGYLLNMMDEGICGGEEKRLNDRKRVG